MYERLSYLDFNSILLRPISSLRPPIHSIVFAFHILPSSHSHCIEKSYHCSLHYLFSLHLYNTRATIPNHPLNPTLTFSFLFHRRRKTHQINLKQHPPKMPRDLIADRAMYHRIQTLFHNLLTIKSSLNARLHLQNLIQNNSYYCLSCSHPDRKSVV